MAAVKAKTPVATNKAINLDQMMNEARNELRTSKDRAMHAAAHCYMIWVETKSVAGKKWFEAKVKHANEVIDAHNKVVDKDAKEVRDYRGGNLKTSHDALYDGKDAAALKLKADAIERITALGKLIDEKRAPKKKVKIETAKTGNEFTMVVKLVFGFIETADASLASRYASVCSFIHEKCKGCATPDVATIVTILEAAGGFEVSLRSQVKAKQAGKSGGNADDIKTMITKAQEENKAAVESMKPLSSFAMSVKTEALGYTVLLARTNGKAVDIVGEAPVTKDQISKMVTAFEPQTINTAAGTEFVYRVLSIGELAGGVVGKATDTKKERKLILRPMEDGKAQLLITLLGGNANVVVHAVPHEHVDLGQVSGMIGLSHDYFATLSQRLDDPLYRRFTVIKPDGNPVTKSGNPAQSKLGWHLVNNALTDNSGASKHETLYWSNSGGSTEKPLDVEAMKSMTRLTVTRDVLIHFWDEVLSKIKSDVAANKKTKVATLKYKGGILVLDVPAKANAEHGVDADVDAAAKLDFRPGDLVALVEKLKDLMVDQFVFELDEDGMMAVTWSDALGSYAVFQPTVMEGGQLNPKRLAKTAGTVAVNLLATLAAKPPVIKVNHLDAAQQITSAASKLGPFKRTQFKRAPAKKAVAA